MLMAISENPNGFVTSHVNRFTWSLAIAEICTVDARAFGVSGRLSMTFTFENVEFSRG